MHVDTGGEVRGEHIEDPVRVALLFRDYVALSTRIGPNSELGALLARVQATPRCPAGLVGSR